MSRSAWFSAFGRPFFFPSVLSLAGLPGSKQRGAWLGTVGPPRPTGSPEAHDTPRLRGCIPCRHEGQEAVAHPGWTSPPSQELDIPGGPRPALAPVATWSRPRPDSSYLASVGREAWEVGPHSGRHPSQAHSCWTPGAGGLLQHKRDRSSLQSKWTAREVHWAQLGT